MQRQYRNRLSDFNGWKYRHSAMWNVFKENNWETIPQKKLLLYDCDVKQVDEEVGTIYKRTIPSIEENIVTKGIENLLPNKLINRILHEKETFIDITTLNQIKRGKETLSISYYVNPDEKKNMCDWVCSNAEAQDFENFKLVFSLIESLLLNE